MPIESRSPTAYGRYPALSRRRLGVFSYVSELYAGERLRLAGYSSGTGVCARGGCSARLCVPVAALCHRLMAGLAVLSRRFASAHGWPCGSVAAFCLGSRPTLRSCRGALPSAHGWPCGSVAALCHRLTPGFAFLSRRFAIGSWLALRFCRRVLPSAHGWLCSSVAAFCHRLTPVFFLLEEKETACDSLRSCSAGSRSPFARSPVLARLSAFGGFTLGLCVSLWRSRREHDRSSLIRKEAPHRVGASFAMDL